MSLTFWIRQHPVIVWSTEWKPPGTPRSELMHLDWLDRTPAADPWVYFLNRMHWAYICAAGGDLRRAKGMTTIEVYSTMYTRYSHPEYPESWDEYHRWDSEILMLENGIQRWSWAYADDDKFEEGPATQVGPALVAGPVIEYATVLGVIGSADVQDWDLYSGQECQIDPPYSNNY